MSAVRNQPSIKAPNVQLKKLLGALSLSCFIFSCVSVYFSEYSLYVRALCCCFKGPEISFP